MGKRRVTLFVIRYWTQLGHQLVELMAMLQYAWPKSQTQYPAKSIWDSSGCLHSAVLEIISLSADGTVLHGVRTFAAVSVHTEQLICNPDKLSLLTCACVYLWGSRRTHLHEHLCTIGKILSIIHTSVFWIFTRSNLMFQISWWMILIQVVKCVMFRDHTWEAERKVVRWSFWMLYSITPGKIARTPWMEERDYSSAES